MCGLEGVVGGKTLGATNITAAVPIIGKPILNRIVADKIGNLFYVPGDLTEGNAYIYKADTSGADIQWMPDAVGGFALHDYAQDDTGNRILVGNGGSVFTYNALSSDMFTMPYPLPFALPTPYNSWILTKGFQPSTLSGTQSSAGDLAKLKDWVYVRVKETPNGYFRCFAMNNNGTIVAGGDNAMLFKSTDGGTSWSDIGTALNIAGNVNTVCFNNSGVLPAGAGDNFYIIDSTLADVISEYISEDATGCIPGWLRSCADFYGDFMLLGPYNVSGEEEPPHYDRGAFTSGDGIDLGGMDPDGSLNLSTWQPSGGRILNICPNFFWPIVLNNGSSNIARYMGPIKAGEGNGVFTKALADDINDFSINGISYTVGWNETLLVGNAGKIYKISGIPGQNNNPVAIPADFVHNIHDAAWGAGAWVMISNRGILVSTDSQSTEIYSDVVCGSCLLYVPKKQIFLANDLSKAGYIKICRL
ncbi:MAG: hypothetical protein GY862_14250 [Gammaproteobacteria bacterium]|nr:hypothetical protein [Gammaproteobacteria bacterium]